MQIFDSFMTAMTGFWLTHSCALATFACFKAASSLCSSLHDEYKLLLAFCPSNAKIYFIFYSPFTNMKDSRTSNNQRKKFFFQAFVVDILEAPIIIIVIVITKIFGT